MFWLRNEKIIFQYTLLSGGLTRCTLNAINILTLIVGERAKTRVGISGTTVKSPKLKFVPSSHPGPFAVVASSRKRGSAVAQW